MKEQQQITVAYLRQRAAHYRGLMTRSTDPRDIDRYREFSQLLDKEADALERHLRAASG